MCMPLPVIAKPIAGVPPSGLVSPRLLTASDLEWDGFWLPALGRPPRAAENLLQEDDLARCFGRLALAMVSARATRTVSLLRGWPQRSLKMLNDDASAAREIPALQADYDRFLTLQAFERSGNPRAAALAKRSIMALPAVQQLRLALELAPGGGCRMYPDLADWLKQKERRLMGSVICEDG